MFSFWKFFLNIKEMIVDKIFFQNKIVKKALKIKKTTVSQRVGVSVDGFQDLFK